MARASNEFRSLQADAIGNNLNGGVLKVYDAAPPAGGTDAAYAGTVLVTYTLNADAFAGAVNGVITANAIASAVASASGTAAGARLFKSGGTAPAFDFKAGLSGAAGVEVGFADPAIVSGATIPLTSFVHTVPAGSVA